MYAGSGGEGEGEGNGSQGGVTTRVLIYTEDPRSLNLAGKKLLDGLALTHIQTYRFTDQTVIFPILSFPNAHARRRKRGCYMVWLVPAKQTIH